MWQSVPPPPPFPTIPTGAFIKTQAQLDAEAMEQHAFHHGYYGPTVPGDMFGGWPMDELVKAVLAGKLPVEQAQAIAELKRKHGLLGVSLGGGALGGMASSQSPVPTRPYTHEERLAMRMGWGRVESSMWAPDFEHVDIHRAAGSSVVHVWVISKSGQSVVLEDDAALFPSDALVTKLTMLKG